MGCFSISVAINEFQSNFVFTCACVHSWIMVSDFVFLHFCFSFFHLPKSIIPYSSHWFCTTAFSIAVSHQSLRATLHKRVCVVSLCFAFTWNRAPLSLSLSSSLLGLFLIVFWEMVLLKTDSLFYSLTFWLSRFMKDTKNVASRLMLIGETDRAFKFWLNQQHVCKFHFLGT